LSKNKETKNGIFYVWEPILMLFASYATKEGIKKTQQKQLEEEKKNQFLDKKETSYFLKKRFTFVSSSFQVTLHHFHMISQLCFLDNEKTNFDPSILFSGSFWEQIYVELFLFLSSIYAEDPNFDVFSSTLIFFKDFLKDFENIHFQNFSKFFDLVFDLQKNLKFLTFFKKKIEEKEKTEEIIRENDEIEVKKEKKQAEINPHHQQLLKSNFYLNFLDKDQLNNFYFVNEQALYDEIENK
jgi:hypothetical protein